MLRSFALWLERRTRPPHEWTPEERRYMDAPKDQWLADAARYCSSNDAVFHGPGGFSRAALRYVCRRG